MTELLERDNLLAEIRQRVEAARSGEGSLLLIAGEAGAGKTSLVTEARRILADRVTAMEGACDPLATPRPLSPLMDFAADPDTGLSHLSDAMEPGEMFATVLDGLRNRLRPAFMVIEDLHWADEGTLDFLRFIGRRVADTNAVVVGTYRDDEVGGDHPLRAVLGQLISVPSTQRIAVEPLSLDAVRVLAAGRVLDVERLHQVSGGNAFFVTEVLETGKAVPDSVQDAVLARLSGLHVDARRAIEAVSIAPRAMELDYVMPLSGVSLSSLDEAVQAGLLSSDGHALRFRHELARAATEASIVARRRLQLHREMAALLSEDDPLDRARIAHHAIRAESPDLIVAWVPDAAREAARRGAHKEAVAFYRAVLPHLSTPDLLADCASELLYVGYHEEALERAEKALELLGDDGSLEKKASAMRLIANAQWNLTHTEAAAATTDKAIDLLRPEGSSPTLAHLLASASGNNMLARRYQRASTLANEALTMAREVGDGAMERRALFGIGVTELVVGDAETGIRVLEEAAEKMRAAGDLDSVASVYLNLGSGAGEVRHYDVASEALERGEEIARSLDLDSSVAYDRAWMARIAFEQGRYSDVAEHVDQVESIATNPEGIAVLTARAALGRTRVRQGDPGGRQLLDKTMELGRKPELQHVWSLWCGVAEHAWLWGKAETIPEILAPLYERALETDSLWARGEIGFWMWMGGAIEAPPAGAAEPFARHMSGDLGGAADAWRAIGCPYEVALALSDGGQEEQFEALSIFDDLGARPAAARLRSLMRQSGVENIPRGPIRETQENPANLTPRQLEVASLMLDGLSNAEIADRLFVSKKTVEHHVSAVFAKLGAESRSEAKAKAAQLLGGD